MSTNQQKWWKMRLTDDILFFLWWLARFCHLLLSHIGILSRMNYSVFMCETVSKIRFKNENCRQEKENMWQVERWQLEEKVDKRCNFLSHIKVRWVDCCYLHQGHRWDWQFFVVVQPERNDSIIIFGNKS